MALRVACVAEAVCVDWEKSALVEEGTEPVSVKKAGAFDWDSCPSLMGHWKERWVRSPRREEFVVRTTHLGSMDLNYLTPRGNSFSL